MLSATLAVYRSDFKESIGYYSTRKRFKILDGNLELLMLIMQTEKLINH
jgi:hypothetical protein